MIAVRLIGGLGNQCFQYAVARHLAEIHKTELKLDVSEFEIYKLHKYSIWAFNIQANMASPEEIAALTLVSEKHLHFDPDILSLPDGVYLRGYWPSEKYFVGIAGIIRKELAVRTPAAGKDKELAERMASCESVGLHIRRGDYVPNSYTGQILETCDLDYYYRCVKNLTRMIERPHFFIFSDDKEWARENLKLPYDTILVDHNGADKNYEDLRLMSLCKHQIIANSSFSWWGAWLNNNPRKVVFGPKKWFNDNARSSSKDLLPSSWIRI